MRLVTGISIALLAMLVALVLACASPVPPTVEPTPNIEVIVEAMVEEKLNQRVSTVQAPTVRSTLSLSPTPNIEATVEAKVKEKFNQRVSTVQAPTVKPTPSPTPTQDPILELILRNTLFDSLLTDNEAVFNTVYPNLHSSIFAKRAFMLEAGHYVPVYMARTCLNGQSPSLTEYRESAVNVFASEKRPDRLASVQPLAKKELIRLYNLAIAIEQQNEQIKPCLRPYLSPISAEDARVALTLLWAVERVPTWMQENAQGAQIQQFSYWISKPPPRDYFINWLCRHNSNPCGT